MLIHCELLILILGLTPASRVHAGEIIGGREAVPHSRPYMALVVQHTQDGETKHCGGFLLQDDFVMTAAHCQARSYTILLGLHRYEKHAKIQQLSVEKTYAHEGFISNDLKNDIMLLKLSSNANLTSTVQPIALADRCDVALPKSCLVSGWGTFDATKYLSRVLMEVNVTLTESQQCAEDNMYCSDGKTGPGSGDSGGPLVCEGKAYGVTSASCNSSRYYFTKISAYRRWVDSILGNTSDKCDD